MRNCNLFPGNLGIERNRMFSLENNNIHAITNIIHQASKKAIATISSGMDGIIPTTSGEATSGRN